MVGTVGQVWGGPAANMNGDYLISNPHPRYTWSPPSQSLHLHPRYREPTFSVPSPSPRYREPTYSVPSPSLQAQRAHLLSPFTVTPGTESPPTQSLHPRYREPTYSVPSPSPQVHRAHLLSPFTFTPGTESPPTQSLETEKFGTEQNLTPVDSK